MNNKARRLFGGNRLLAYHASFPSGWLDLGAINSYKPIDDTNDFEGEDADGAGYTIDGKRTVKLEVLLGETDKTKRDLVDTLRGKAVQLWLNHGEVNGKFEYIFYREAIVIPKMSMDVPGNPQQILLKFGIQPQSSIVQCTVSGTTYTGLNKFYVNIAANAALGNPTTGFPSDSNL